MAYKVVNGKLQKVKKTGNDDLLSYVTARTPKSVPVTEDQVALMPNGKPADAGNYGATCWYSACLRPKSATWYNRGSMKFYCRACAEMLTHANRHDSFCKDENGQPLPLCYEVKTAAEAENLHVMP